MSEYRFLTYTHAYSNDFILFYELYLAIPCILVSVKSKRSAFRYRTFQFIPVYILYKANALSGKQICCHAAMRPITCTLDHDFLLILRPINMNAIANVPIFFT